MFYPFGITKLLQPDERLNLNFIHSGYEDVLATSIGKIVENGPLQSVSREKIYGIIRGTSLDTKLKWMLKKEYAILADQNRIRRIPHNLSSISGGYTPITDELVHHCMFKRFQTSRLENPYDASKSTPSRKPYIAIHYRIGDMRFKYRYPTAKGDGILSPETFKKIVSLLPSSEKLEVRVVSENPSLATKLLEEVGIEASYSSEEPSIWEDLSTMCESKFLISPYSTVSIFAACVRSHLGRLTYFPKYNSVGVIPKWSLERTISYEPQYLTEEHWIYSEDTQDGSLGTYKGYS